MARDIIGTITCAYCKKDINIATEDIAWESIENHGECDDNTTLHDFAINQKIQCPSCNNDNNILISAKGTSIETLNYDSLKIIPMEKSAYIE